MPTLAIGAAGAANAGLSIGAMLALNDGQMRDKLIAFRASQAGKIRNATLTELN